MVERGEAPRKQIGLLIGQVDGDAEAEMLGHRRHDRRQQDRIVERRLRPGDQRRLRAALVDVVEPDDVGDEQAVEQPSLQGARQVLPIFDVGVFG
jgi:hypothetical protein